MRSRGLFELHRPLRYRSKDRCGWIIAVKPLLAPKEGGEAHSGQFAGPQWNRKAPRPCRRALTNRVVDVAPTLDGFDVAVHRVEARTHRHDRYMAPSSLAPRCNIARPLVVPATVLLDGLEAERVAVPSELDKLGFDPRLDLNRFGLDPARKRNPSPILAARSNTASLKPPSQIGIFRFGRGIIPALSMR